MPNIQMCYRRNHLSRVILRLDFASASLGPLIERPAFSDRVSSVFPHVDSQAIMQLAFSFSPEGGGGVEQHNQGTQWFHRKQPAGDTYVILGPTFLSLEYGPNNYASFPALLEDFRLVFGALIQTTGIARFDRIGLRYVNEISLQHGSALDWNGYISQDLLASVNASMLAEGRMLRSMHQVAQQIGEDQILFNYGISNPDFPSPVVQRHFVLDIDCYRQGVIESVNAEACISRLNDLASDLFEKSIDGELRNNMEIVS